MPNPEGSQSDQPPLAFMNAVASMPLPMFSFNAYAISFSTSDFTAALYCNNRPVSFLFMPPSVAKSFALALMSAVKDYEKASNISVQTIEELVEQFEKLKAGASE